MTNSYDELVNSNICTGSASYSDMMKCSCYECYKCRKSYRKKRQQFAGVENNG